MFVTDAYGQETAPAVEGGHGDAPAEAGHVAGTEAAHDGGHGEAGFPPFDSSTFPSQILWIAITFGLFYLFLKKVIMPRLAGILAVREKRIAQDLDQAAGMKGEADAAVAAYEQELAEARAKSNAIAQQARDKAKADADAERRTVETALEKKLADAEASIASIKASAMKEVGSIAEQTAATIVQELVGASVDRADVATAVAAARK